MEVDDPPPPEDERFISMPLLSGVIIIFAVEHKNNFGRADPDTTDPKHKEFWTAIICDSWGISSFDCAHPR